MDRICPTCGSELSEGVTVCANCGAAADTKPTVDNSNAINRMLASGEESVLVETDELNAEQEAAFNSGKAVEFSNAAPGTTGVVELSENPDMSEAIMAMDSMKLDDILPPKPDTEPVQEHHDDDDDDVVLKKGVTEIKRYKLPAPVKKAIAICFVLCLTFAGGFALRFAMTLGVFDDYANKAGLDSLNKINMRIPEGYDFIAFDIYVKRGGDVTECIIFGVLYSEVGEYEPTYYRMLINNTDRSQSHLIYPFNQKDYDMLVNSDDPVERTRAASMTGLYENFLLSLSEINAGSSRWVRADVSHIKSRMQ